MTRKQWLVGLGAPVASYLGYIVVMCLANDEGRRWIDSEQGPTELGTATLFALAGVMAAAIAWRAAATPLRYRALFGLGAAVMAFVALEEISYGQHLFGWSSPDYMREHNFRQETNLHNLHDNALSHQMRLGANLLTPLVFIILPLVLLRRENDYRPGSAAWCLLPKRELIGVAVVASFCTTPQKIIDTIGHGGRRWLGLGELKELYWSIAAAGLMFLLYRRHVRHAAQVAAPPANAAPQTATQQKRAA